jgi:hypothetical protein
MIKKTLGYFGIISIILMLVIPNIVALEEINSSREVYESGWFILVSPNVEGIENGLHLGGMHDLNITALGGNTFLIFTKPIWGTAIITNYVDLNIQMVHFFGIADIFDNQGVIIGKCEDVSWEKI